MSRWISVKQAIGVASIGIGLIALIAPRGFSRLIGVAEAATPEAVAAFGSRELAAGAALLSPVKFGPFLWFKVAGDMIDLGGLALAMRKPQADRRLLAIAGAAAGAIAAFDLFMALQDQGQPD